MKSLGIQGIVRDKPHKTTVPDKTLPCPLDKVNRQFRAPAPNMLWVSGFTYVATWKGFVYVDFVIDAYGKDARPSVTVAAWISCLNMNRRSGLPSCSASFGHDALGPRGPR